MNEGAGGVEDDTTSRAPRPRAMPAWAYAALGLLFFSLVFADRFQPLLGAEGARIAPVTETFVVKSRFSHLDQRYAIWAIERNSRALLSSPLGFFEANHCFPSPGSLALGHGVVALGALAAPLRWITDDPIALHNLVWILHGILSTLAFAFLVARWTGEWEVGLLVGLIYGLHPARIGTPQHFYLTDVTGLILGLAVLPTWVRCPRWGSTAVLAVGVVWQLAAGVYPAYSALIVGLLTGGTLLVREGIPRDRALRLALHSTAVVGVGVAAAAFLYLPYLEHASGGEYRDRVQYFLALGSFLPWGSLWPGGLLLGLAAIGCWLRSPGPGPGRAALLATFLLLAWIATGGQLLPLDPDAWLGSFERRMNRHPTPLFAWVQSWLPGLRIGRAPLFLYVGAHLCMALVAAMGVSALLARVRREWRRWARGGVLAVACAVAFVPGLVPAARYHYVDQYPGDDAIAFFRGLPEDAAMLELPLVKGEAWWNRASASLLLSAYHHRRTSECFSSFVESHLSEANLDAIDALPAMEARVALVAAGFTTLVVHLPEGRALRRRLAGSGMRVLARGPGLVAYELRPPAGPEPRPGGMQGAS